MKFIRFTMSKGEGFILPEDKASAILNDKGQLVKVTENGFWTGETINKAHIVSTHFDLDATRDHRREHTPQIEAPKESKINRTHINKSLKRVRKDLEKKEVLSKPPK